MHLFSILLTVLIALNVHEIRAAKAPLKTFINDIFDTYCGPHDVCVKHLQCNDGKINRYGRKIIHPRIGEERIATTGYANCSDYLEVCCNLDNKVTNPKPAPLQQAQQGCGYRNAGGVSLRILDVDKNVAEFAEFPWMTAIMKNDQYLCGGALIYESVVLTVAHYTHNEAPYSLTARAGEWDTQTINEPLSHEDRFVIKIIAHENYRDEDENLFYDIALLFLDRPFEMKANIQPICLPDIDANFDDSRCFVTGWGKDKFGHEGQQQVFLKKIEISVIPHDKCEGLFRATSALGRHFNLHETFICAGGEEGKDACEGDGGSPLVCPVPGQENRYQLAGLVAWGIECGLPNVPGAYVSVTGLRTWINNNLILGGCDSQLLEDINAEKNQKTVLNLTRDKRKYDNGCAPNEVCVRSFQCRNGKINRDGRGIIHKRIGGEENETVIGKCEHYMDTCCDLEDFRNVSLHKEPVVESEVPEGGCGFSKSITINESSKDLAQFAEFPWMVAILKEENYICSGVLLSDSVVLTLGSCVKDYESRKLNVRAGEWDTETIKEPLVHENRLVRKIIEHENFSSSTKTNFNIALLFLSRPFELKTHINPICLPQLEDINLTDTECLMTGWGEFKNPTAKINILKKSTWKISPNNGCVASNCKLAEFMSNSANACSKLDIGSPLICKMDNLSYQLIGLMQTCVESANSATTAVTFIPFYNQWLTDKIGGYFNNTLSLDIRTIH